MTTYATRALPWPLLLLVCALVVVVLRVLQLDPWTLWPLQGVALGLLSGGIAWCLDETSADVVDTQPRGLAWRTTARCAGVLVLLLAWTGAVVMARADLFGHATAVWWQGVCLALVTVAAVTWSRALGHPTPGHTWALTVTPVVTVWSLVRPAADQMPLLPYADGPWGTSTALWTGLGGLAGVALALALLEARWWRAHPRVAGDRAAALRRRGRAPA